MDIISENKHCEETCNSRHYLKSKELLNILSCEVGMTWNGRYDEKELKPTLVSALEYISNYEGEGFYYGFMNSTELQISDRQYIVADIALKHLLNKNFKDAYHELWACIDDNYKGHGEENYINPAEYIIYRSLIQYFIQLLPDTVG